MPIANTLSSDVMLQLGAFKFGVSTAAYQDLARTTEQKWASQARFGQREALQYIGPGADTITLQGVIYPEWRGGIGQPDALRELAALGEPQILVDGLGVVHGRWVVERVDERQDRFAAAGVPLKQQFTVGLRKFDDGEPASTARADGLPSELTPSTRLAPQPFTSQAEAAAAVGDLASSGKSAAATLTNALQSNLVKFQAVAGVLGATRAASAAGALTRGVECAATLSAACAAATGLAAAPSAARNAAAVGGILTAASAMTTTSTSSGVVLSRLLSSLGATVDPATAAVVRGAVLDVNTLTRLCRDTAATASGYSDRIPA